MAGEGSDWVYRWELLVADAWADPDLKERLLKDPASVLKERGMTPPEGVEVKVLEQTDDCWPLVIPKKPPEGELSAQALQGVAGGQPCMPPCGPPPPCMPPCGPPPPCMGPPCGPPPPCMGPPCGPPPPCRP